MNASVFAKTPQPWTLWGRALARAELARVREIERDNRRAAKPVRRCPGCGCSKRFRCTIVLPNDLGLGFCAQPGELPGHEVCSACLDPSGRGDARLWNMPDPETIAEMVALGLAVPVLR